MKFADLRRNEHRSDAEDNRPDRLHGTRRFRRLGQWGRTTHHLRRWGH